MRYRIHGITARYDKESPEEIKRALLRKLGDAAKDLKSHKVVRRSIDARHTAVRFVYTIDFDLKTDTPPGLPGISTPKNLPPIEFKSGERHLDNPPIIVGAGPAGLLAAYTLAIHGYKPLLIERGGNVPERAKAVTEFKNSRVPNPENNYLYGLGGAGTFSDGKLTTSVDHPLIASFLRLLVECGAPEEILIDSRPHVGTDRLRNVVVNLVKKIEAAGGTVMTNTRVDGIRIEQGCARGVETTAGSFDTSQIVLATGHSARDTWKWLRASGITMEPKPFQMGIRVEHPQRWLDKSQYGDAAGHPALGAADYKLTTRIDKIPVFTFCMCPGGETMPTVNETGHLAVNGMSYHARDNKWASSGIVVTLTPETYGGTDFDSCIGFQRSIESKAFEMGGGDYTAPAQRLTDFVSGKQTPGPLPEVSFKFGARNTPITEILPSFLTTPLQKALVQFDRKLKGYLHPEAVAIAPEARASSPIRMVRDLETRQAIGVEGLYPAGEGAGYAGGITSAALDGLNAAGMIIEQFQALHKD